MKQKQNTKYHYLPYFKYALLLFWILWLVLAITTNIADGLKALGFLPSHFIFSSNNLEMISKVTAIYQTLPLINATIFTAILFFEIILLLFFILSLIKFKQNSSNKWSYLNITFSFNLCFWLFFILFHEFFINYFYEWPFMVYFIFTAISFLAIHLIPETSGDGQNVDTGS